MVLDHRHLFQVKKIFTRNKCLCVGHTINSAFILHLTGNIHYWCWTHTYSAFKLHSTANLQYIKIEISLLTKSGPQEGIYNNNYDWYTTTIYQPKYSRWNIDDIVIFACQLWPKYDFNADNVKYDVIKKILTWRWMVSRFVLFTHLL